MNAIGFVRLNRFLILFQKLSCAYNTYLIIWTLIYKITFKKLTIRRPVNWRNPYHHLNNFCLEAYFICCNSLQMDKSFTNLIFCIRFKKKYYFTYVDSFICLLAHYSFIVKFKMYCCLIPLVRMTENLSAVC